MTSYDWVDFVEIILSQSAHFAIRWRRDTLVDLVLGKVGAISLISSVLLSFINQNKAVSDINY